jgi:ABC-type transport system substrate-binding protein
MIAGWGNERFTYNYSVGGGNNYARLMHGFLIATNEKSELLPGIASSWDFSPDGRTWTVTVREGAKFHDSHYCRRCLVELDALLGQGPIRLRLGAGNPEQLSGHGPSC